MEGGRGSIQKVKVVENAFQVMNIRIHPSLDNPQKKNPKTHLGDPKIDQVDGAGYPKTFETKSS